MVAFAALYFIQNDSGTYRAFDSAGAEAYSGTSLVTDVLNAIEAAHGTGNYHVLFGVGTFDMGTENWALNGDSDIAISGQGIGITLIQNSSTAAADTEPFSITDCDRITMRDFDVSAGGTARSTSDCLDFDNADECLIERVRVLASRGSGIVFDGKDAGAQAIRNIIRDVIVTGADLEGIQLLAADFNTVEGCHVYGNGEVGIKLNRKTSATVQNCEGNILRGNFIHDNDEAGVEILECVRNLVIGNHIYNNGQVPGSDDGVLIDDFGTAGLATEDNAVIGNFFYDTQGTPTQDRGVYVADAAVDRTLVANNWFDGNHLTAEITDLGAKTRIRGNTGYPDNVAREVTTTETIDPDDPASMFNGESSGGAYTITLPDNAAAVGRILTFRREGANDVTVSRAGSDTIDGATTKVLGSDKAAIGLASVGDGVYKVISTEGTVT